MKERQRNIFVVESHEACRVGLGAVLANAGYSIRMFDDPQTCLELVHDDEIKCDLIITGLRLAPFGGLEFIRRIRLINPFVALIVLTSSTNATMAVQTLKLGVSDFIGKPVAAENLILSVEKTISDGSVQNFPVKGFLTKIEYEVLVHIVNGESTKQIAATRCRSCRTIEDQRYNIMKKLKVGNVIDLLKRVAFVVVPDELSV